MRKFLGTVDFEGVVVIGEGVKDNAPMLFNGEVVGTGRGPKCDIAVDPIDGTSLTAAGRSHAISMLAVSDRGTMLDASSVFYMDKIVTNSLGADVVSLEQSAGDNVREFARALGKPVGELVVAVLDRPRHEGLIDEIRSAGAATRLILDGDVAGGINAALPGTRIDMCLGIGGCPEGVATAAAIKALGGFMQGRIAPKDEAESQRGIAAGLRMDYVYGQDELVKGDNTIFVVTGVTDGSLVRGVERDGDTILTESLILRSRSGTIRRIQATHLAAKWLED
jgi:fructose-1,6-bisphosphatase II